LRSRTGKAMISQTEAVGHPVKASDICHASSARSGVPVTSRRAAKRGARRRPCWNQRWCVPL